MSEQHTFVLQSPTGADLHGVVDFPKQGGPRPTVVVCHGFKGFLEWGFFPPLAELLRERGFTVVRFNFSGAGMRPGDELVTDLEAFRAALFSQDRDDLLRVIAALGEEIAPGRVDPGHVGVVGHSRGGGAAILAAAHDAGRDKVHALITWNAVATFDRFKPYEDAWRRDGFIPLVNGRTGQELEIGVEVLDDLQKNASDLDLKAAAAKVRAPWRILHGASDETVPVAEALSLDAAAQGVHELQIIDDADHTWGAKHPFAGPTPYLITAMNHTQIWLRRHLC